VNWADVELFDEKVQVFGRNPAAEESRNVAEIIAGFAKDSWAG